MLLNSHNDALLSRIRRGLVRLGYFSKPQFLIIGAQKAGTTALFYYLAEHPNIMPPNDKEIGFFSPELFEDWPEHPNHHILCTPERTHFFDRRTYPKVAAWYHSLFPLPHKLRRPNMTYEATPEYLYYPEVAERIFKYEPKMKLIVLLRDPVDRAFSAWNMYCNFTEEGYRPLVYAPRRETRGFDEAVRDELDGLRAGKAKLDPGYVRRGLYYEQLSRYFKFFKRDQILILDSRELKRDTSNVVDQVVRFLGLPAYRFGGEWQPFFVGEYKSEIPNGTLRLLREFYKPHNEKLNQLLDHDFGW